MSPSITRFNFLRNDFSKQKDALIPVFIHLSERYITKAPDKNEVDKAFGNYIKKYPKLQRKPLLKKLVDDFSSIPVNIKRQRFVSLNTGQTRLAPISLYDAKRAFLDLKVVPRRPPNLVPYIKNLAPAESTYGYIAGQQITAVGRAFSEQKGKNTVEIWSFDPDNPQLKFTLQPIRQNYSEVTFNLPNNIDPGTWHLRIIVESNRKTDYIVFKISAPGMRILNVDPQNQQPGQWINITGQNFRPGELHNILFTNMELATSVPVSITAYPHIDNPTTQFHVQIPNEIVAGDNQIQISINDNVTPPSNLFVYSIGIPEYRVVFKKIHCYDETDWGDVGEDEVYTLWAITADGKVWSKHSKSYSFDDEDKTEQSYDLADSQVFSTEGQFGQVQFGLSFNTALYETEEDDINTAKELIGFFGEIAGYIISALGGGATGKTVTQKVAEGLQILVKWLFDGDVTIGYSTQRPGPLNEYWDAITLQKTLIGSNASTEDFILDFHGDEDHGWYKVWYNIMRR